MDVHGAHTRQSRWGLEIMKKNVNSRAFIKPSLFPIYYCPALPWSILKLASSLKGKLSQAAMKNILECQEINYRCLKHWVDTKIMSGAHAAWRGLNECCRERAKMHLSTVWTFHAIRISIALLKHHLHIQPQKPCNKVDIPWRVRYYQSRHLFRTVVFHLYANIEVQYRTKGIVIWYVCNKALLGKFKTNSTKCKYSAE